jgi:uncharacterized protein (TIGR02145 family)
LKFPLICDDLNFSVRKAGNNCGKMKIAFKLIFLSLTFLIPGCSGKDKTSDPVIDINGNVYQTVKIGSRIWMKENLKTTKLNDGTEIPLIKDNNTWNMLSGNGYCWYNNDEAAFKDIYGALYNGFTALSGRICPDGWHVPSKDEWETLKDFGDDPLKAGGILKESGTDHWLTPNKGATNTTGFSALPAGIRYYEGTFASSGTFTGFWSSDETENEEYFTGLYHSDAGFVIDHKDKRYGFSIRCVKN